jgi:hypothetical protein
MCRSIHTLHNFEPPATNDEIRAASVQYVRKIIGSAKPSRANQAAVDRAIEAVTAATAELLAAMVSSTPPRDREIEYLKTIRRFERRRATELAQLAAAR